MHGSYQKSYDDASQPQEINFDRGGGGLGYSYIVDENSTVLAEVTAGRDTARSRGFDDVRGAFSTRFNEVDSETVETELQLNPRLREYVTAVRGGSQWIYRSDDLSMVPVSFVGGFQFLHERASRFERSLVTDDARGEFTNSGLELNSEQAAGIGGTDFYFYPTWHVTRSVNFTAGVVRTDIRRELAEVPPFVAGTDTVAHWSPEIGLTVAPIVDLTLRSAYFESLRKSSLEDQVSIEPTIIGGLTERFNDLSATQSRNSGFGADYKLGLTYFGAEYSRRYLSEPGTLASANIITDETTGAVQSNVQIDERFDNHVEQDFSRAYVYQVLSDQLVASLDYRYGTDAVTDREAGSDFLLHRYAAQLKYFHSSGFFGFTGATWRKQQGINNPAFADGKEVAWLFDAGVGYRLPKRRGTVQLEAFNLADTKFAFDQSRGFEDAFAAQLGLRLVAAINF